MGEADNKFELARTARADLQKKIDDLCTCGNAWRTRGVTSHITLNYDGNKFSGVVKVMLEVE